MYCSKCGKQISDGSRFCQYCGDECVCFNQRQMQVPAKTAATAHPMRKGLVEFAAFIGISAIIVIIAIFSYGSPAEKQLVGQWESTIDDGSKYMEFFSDGTVLMESSIAWQEEGMERYDYRVEDDNLTNTLIIEDYSEEVMRVEFDVSGDYLELYPEDGDAISYHRI